MPDDLLRLVVATLAIFQLAALARVVVDYRPRLMERHQAARYGSLALITLAIAGGQFSNLHAAITWRTWVLLVGLGMGFYGTWSHRYTDAAVLEEIHRKLADPEEAVFLDELARLLADDQPMLDRLKELG